MPDCSCLFYTQLIEHIRWSDECMHGGLAWSRDLSSVGLPVDVTAHAPSRGQRELSRNQFEAAQLVRLHVCDRRLNDRDWDVDAWRRHHHKVGCRLALIGPERWDRREPVPNPKEIREQHSRQEPPKQLRHEHFTSQQPP